MLTSAVACDAWLLITPTLGTTPSFVAIWAASVTKLACWALANVGVTVSWSPLRGMKPPPGLPAAALLAAPVAPVAAWLLPPAPRCVWASASGGSTAAETRPEALEPSSSSSSSLEACWPWLPRPPAELAETRPFPPFPPCLLEAA